MVGKDPWVLPTAIYSESGDKERLGRANWNDSFGDRWEQEPELFHPPPLSLFVDMPDNYLKHQKLLKGAQVRCDYGMDTKRPASWRPKDTGRSSRSVRPSTGQPSWRSKPTHRSRASAGQPSWRSKQSSRPPTAQSRAHSWRSRPSTGYTTQRSDWLSEPTERTQHTVGSEQHEIEQLRTNLRSAGAALGGTQGLGRTVSSVGSRAGTRVGGFGPIR